MKVCTDSCLQGALAAQEVSKIKPHTGLDIGTGTGLLSLMLIQSHSFEQLDAIEINEEACQQARQNVSKADMGKHIHIIHEDIRKFHSSFQYDFIICNPPFYANDLKSSSVTKNQAMHSSHLTYEELLQKIHLFLSSSGSCCIMIPTQKENVFNALSFENKLFITQIYHIINQPGKDILRSILFLSKKESIIERREISIRNSSHQYTADFKQLLRPYYLGF